VSVRPQATDQVRSHPPESYHAELHRVICCHYLFSFGGLCRHFGAGRQCGPAFDATPRVAVDQARSHFLAEARLGFVTELI